MKTIHYTYAILRYRHDPVAGETMNVGVLVDFPALDLLMSRIDTTTRHLSRAFAKFDAHEHRQVLKRFQDVVFALAHDLRVGQGTLFDREHASRSAAHYAGIIWPDKGTRYFWHGNANGIIRLEPDQDPTKAAQRTVANLFDRFVQSQRPPRLARRSRSDDDVWNSTRMNPAIAEFQHALQPEKVLAAGFEFRFDHTTRNGKLHVVQPLSLDLLDADSIRDKALRWYGYGHALTQAKALGKLVLVLGVPSDPELQKAFQRSRKLLNEMPLKPEILEENDLSAIAETLESLVR